MRRGEVKSKQVTSTFKYTLSRATAEAEMRRGTEELGVTSLLALASAEWSSVTATGKIATELETPALYREETTTKRY